MKQEIKTRTGPFISKEMQYQTCPMPDSCGEFSDDEILNNFTIVDLTDEIRSKIPFKESKTKIPVDFIFDTTSATKSVVTAKINRYDNKKDLINDINSSDYILTIQERQLNENKFFIMRRFYYDLTDELVVIDKNHIPLFEYEEGIHDS